jgi:3D (Asp-Asp-Asp) domain-containing protein
MKRHLIALGLLCLAGTAAIAAEETMLARVTVYWASGGSGSDNCTRQHIAASGARLRAGHCAVDPHRIPYGSKVVVGDTTCLAVDTGKHVVSRRAARKAGRTTTERNAIVIDRFFETKGQALAWASRNPHFMTVRIVSPNERSETTTTISRPGGSAPSTAEPIAVNPAHLRPGSQIAAMSPSLRRLAYLP